MHTKFINFAIDLAKQVGKIHLAYFRSDNLDITTKSNITDVVTRVDKESEQFIVSTILDNFADHKILGEEGGSQGNPNSDYMWVVDPLDGTTNYSQGLPVFAVSIGLQYKGQTIVGVVYAPYLDELYYAEKECGAFAVYAAGEPIAIKVSAKESLNCSVIATGFPYDKGENVDNNSNNVARMLPQVRDIRRMGSAAYDLCAVACSMLDGYWEMNLNLWDVCAGNLIVEEAGGEVLNYRSDRKISLIAGSDKIVHLIKDIVK